MVFLLNLNDMLDNCNVCEGKGVWVLANVLSDGANEVYEAYTDCRTTTNAHVYHGTWAEVINILIQRFSIGNTSMDLQNIVTQVFQRRDNNNLKFETQYFKASRQCRNIFLAMEKVNYYVCDLKPSFCKKMLEKVRSMPPNMRSNFTSNRLMFPASVNETRLIAKIDE